MAKLKKAAAGLNRATAETCHFLTIPLRVLIRVAPILQDRRVAVEKCAGVFTLGVLINPGARIGKFNPDGSANSIPGHSMPGAQVGLMLIIAGFWRFPMACVSFPGEPRSWGQRIFATIHGTPVTLSPMTFNILMGFAGGAIAAWVVTHDLSWMMSGALGGIIFVAAELDHYWSPMAFVIAMIGGVIKPIASSYGERMKIDDAFGAVALHGVVGPWGVAAVGIFASGYLTLTGEGAPQISLYGQGVGAVVMAVLGFGPGYLVSRLLKFMGLLRSPARGRDHGSGQEEGACRRLS